MRSDITFLCRVVDFLTRNVWSGREENNSLVENHSCFGVRLISSLMRV